MNKVDCCSYQTVATTCPVLATVTQEGGSHFEEGSPQGLLTGPSCLPWITAKEGSFAHSLLFPSHISQHQLGDLEPLSVDSQHVPAFLRLFQDSCLPALLSSSYAQSGQDCFLSSSLGLTGQHYRQALKIQFRKI